MLPKNYHFSSEPGSKVMQKTADILLGTKCQHKKLSGRGTEEVIYVRNCTQRGILHVKAFHWRRANSTFSHVSQPSYSTCPISILLIPFYASPSKVHFTLGQLALSYIETVSTIALENRCTEYMSNIRYLQY